MSPDDGWMLDMLLAARRAAGFVAGLDRAAFDRHQMAQSATIRELIVVGEAASQVSDAGRARVPGIPWPQIVGMRHKLVHHYFKTDLDLVWDAATRYIPALIEALAIAVPPEDAAL